jgi:hypothetical protein
VKHTWSVDEIAPAKLFCPTNNNNYNNYKRTERHASHRRRGARLPRARSRLLYSAAGAASWATA